MTPIIYLPIHSVQCASVKVSAYVNALLSTPVSTTCISECFFQEYRQHGVYSYVFFKPSHDSCRGCHRSFIFYRERFFLALGCICTLYLKYIFDIFENIKNFKIIFCVYMSMFYIPTKLFSTKNDFLYDLYKNDKIWY
jgi:hypothetical protein